MPRIYYIHHFQSRVRLKVPLQSFKQNPLLAIIHKLLVEESTLLAAGLHRMYPDAELLPERLVLN
jgi:hypothetical protein